MRIPSEAVSFVPSLIQTVIRILYPDRCPICDRTIPHTESLCSACKETDRSIHGPVCMTCGRPVEKAGVLCKSCREAPRSFVTGRSLFPYQDEIKRAIHKMKYENRADLGERFGELLYARFSRDLQRWGIDQIVPIPLHRNRLRTRGYNQAEVIGKRLSQKSGIPLCTDSLIRVRDTHALKDAGRKERQQILHHAFASGKGKLPPGCVILLIDDIYTTGTTVEEASRILLQQGAKRIYVLTVAIALPASFEFDPSLC